MTAMRRLGGAIAMVAALVGATGCEPRAGLVLTPVVLVEPAPDELFSTDPLFAPDEGECDDCREREVVLAAGETVRVRFREADRDEALAVAASDVAFVELDEGAEVVAASPSDREATRHRHAAYAVLEGAGAAAWERFAAVHARDYVLVEIGGRAVDLTRPLGWTRGVRIGVFADEAARARFVAGLPFARSELRP